MKNSLKRNAQVLAKPVVATPAPAKRWSAPDVALRVAPTPAQAKKVQARKPIASQRPGSSTLLDELQAKYPSSRNGGK